MTQFNGVRLNVPYESQLDNVREPERSCNTSACSMAARYIKPGCVRNDDELRKLVDQFGDTTDHGALTKALLCVGVRSQWHINLDFVDLDRELTAGRPIVIGVLHRGSADNPKGGHMVVVSGYNKDTDKYILKDPFGEYPYTTDDSGDGYEISREWMRNRWLVRQPKNGWGRTFDQTESLK
jgi:hypothetical protein